MVEFTYKSRIADEILKKKLKSFRQVSCQATFDYVTYKNAMKLFGLT